MGPSSEPGDAPSFIFATCQIGAESALKSEIARLQPEFHFAYSRPGFLTFKLPSGYVATPDVKLDSIFARTWGYTIGKVKAETMDEAAAEVWRLVSNERFDALHVWQRDLAAVGFRGFEPHVTPAALSAEEALRRHSSTDTLNPPLGRVAEANQQVLDCIIVEPHEWWIGKHWAADDDSRFPGGMRELPIPEEIISRAYIKAAEGLAWSGLPIKPGQTCVEIGCAPGGASQLLLERGLKVLGIDPARVDDRVLSHAGFTHIRKRGADVRRREFRGVNWLMADMNVAPDYTLDTVEAIVTHETTNISGMLLTLKLLEWKLADSIPEYLSRIRSWGYPMVAARQLPHNRQEICVTALRRARSQS